MQSLRYLQQTFRTMAAFLHETAEAHLLQDLQEAQCRPRMVACRQPQPCPPEPLLSSVVISQIKSGGKQPAYQGIEFGHILQVALQLHLMEFSWAIICSSVGLELASGAGRASGGVDATVSAVFCSPQLSPGSTETLFTEVWRVFSARPTLADGLSVCL